MKKHFKQTGLKSRTNPGSYRRAGVLPISATEHGFENPKKVVASCMAEIGMEQQLYKVSRLMPPGRLNKMTDELFKKIEEHKS